MGQPVPPDEGGVVPPDDGGVEPPDGAADPCDRAVPPGDGLVPADEGAVPVAPFPLAGRTPTPTLLFAALQLTPAAYAGGTAT